MPCGDCKEVQAHTKKLREMARSGYYAPQTQARMRAIRRKQKGGDSASELVGHGGTVGLLQRGTRRK